MAAWRHNVIAPTAALAIAASPPVSPQLHSPRHAHTAFALARAKLRLNLRLSYLWLRCCSVLSLRHFFITYSSRRLGEKQPTLLWPHCRGSYLLACGGEGCNSSGRYGAFVVSIYDADDVKRINVPLFVLPLRCAGTSRLLTHRFLLNCFALLWIVVFSALHCAESIPFASCLPHCTHATHLLLQLHLCWASHQAELIKTRPSGRKMKKQQISIYRALWRRARCAASGVSPSLRISNLQARRYRCAAIKPRILALLNSEHSGGRLTGVLSACCGRQPAPSAHL